MIPSSVKVSFRILFKYRLYTTLVVCCMGLFAVFSLHLLQKTKEMGIRKVLGASPISLIKSLTQRTMTIAFVAFGIAIPISWYFATNWLNAFTYRIQVDSLIFVLSAIIILLMCCFTLIYHVSKAVNINPVDALRNE